MPLLLAVTVLPTHPAVKIHLESTRDMCPISTCCLCVPQPHSGHQSPETPNLRATLFSGSTSSGGARQEHKKSKSETEPREGCQHWEARQSIGSRAWGNRSGQVSRKSPARRQQELVCKQGHLSGGQGQLKQGFWEGITP